jgi:quercetin dioxygenase-like cupin family protein
VQKEGDSIQEILPGDVIYFEANEKHWHGASPNKAMSHIAIQEEVNGSVVTWMEKVSAEQYVK